MALIHHNGLRVNADVPAEPDQMEVLRESGWTLGPHRDTDPDDPSPIPRVLPAPDPDAPNPPAAKASAKANKKD